MKTNIITVSINKPIEEVFKFTTNPKNTHLWINFIDEEITDEFPPKVWTIYRNRRWESRNTSTVTIYEKNVAFKLENKSFSVEYNYNNTGNSTTELIYIESIKQWKLSQPFTQEVLEKLKVLIESST